MDLHGKELIATFSSRNAQWKELSPTSICARPTSFTPTKRRSILAAQRSACSGSEARTAKARALSFLEDLKSKTEPRFREENRELFEFRRSIEGTQAPELEPWDVAYYSEKQRAALYDFDEESLRPYFPLEQVVAGMFGLVHRLYGIRVTQVEGVPGWDEQVRYYDVHDAQPANSWVDFMPIGIRGRTSAGAPGWTR